MAKFKRNTHFVAGFNFQGKRESNTGEDVLTVDISEDQLTNDELMDGTPLTISGFTDTDATISSDDYVSSPSAAQFEAEVTADGETPDMILYSRISDELDDFEWVMTNIQRDEVKPGDPATAVLQRKGQIIATRLVEDGEEPADGDEVYINDSGEYTADDDGGDRTEIGECIEVIDSPDIKDEDDNFYLIKLT